MFRPDDTAVVSKEALKYMGASLDWACDEFGQQNVVGFSVHLDEYNPQLQVLVTPVTDDGRLAQKDFFKNPADLKHQHRELRKRMEAAGYDVEHRVTERSTEHLSSSEFQAKADRMRDAAQDIEDDKEAYETLFVSMGNRERNLDGRESSITKKELELAAAAAAAHQAAEAACAAERTARASQIAAQRAWHDAERERELLRVTNERLEQLPPDVDSWLDKVKWNGKPAREYFDKDMADARASRAEVRRLIDGDGPSRQFGNCEAQAGA